MPGKKKDDEYSKIEPYKKFETYKQLLAHNDDINDDIEYLYYHNVWNLDDKFKNFKIYLGQINSKSELAWLNGIQYLDYTSYPKPLNNISLKDFKEGKYISTYIERKKKISPKTDENYAKRISFWTKTFDTFNQFQNSEDLMWIVWYNRLLMFNILKYHNDKGHSISTVNSDFKAMVRIIKLMLGTQHELRYKYSSLQTGITDIENLGDDFNKVVSKQEVSQFVIWEQLSIIADNLENKYWKKYNELTPRIRNSPTKHPNELFNMHQDLLALALYVWNFPTRFEGYTLEFITDIKDAQPDKNYVLIPKGDEPVKMIFNENKKNHDPIQYYLEIDIPVLDKLNKRLSDLLKYSYTTYPRKYLFVNRRGWRKQNTEQIAPSTIATWLRNLLPDKNIGVDGLRSAFVSYWLPKVNNKARRIIATRMRSSVDILNRSYFKQVYDSPDSLIQAKTEPTEELKQKVKTGQKSTPIDVDNVTKNKVKKEQDDNIQTENSNLVDVGYKIKPAIPIKNKQQINKDAWTKWYAKDKNKELHRERVKKSNNPKSYANRIARELNDNKILYNSIKPSTIEKYSIKKNNEGKYYTDLK